jgi:TPP-dependent 2-oxoacid decarboxylase
MKVREGVNATYFVLNKIRLHCWISTFNETHEVEKFIHGVNRGYNRTDSEWDYASALSRFGVPLGKEHTFSV